MELDWLDWIHVAVGCSLLLMLGYECGRAIIVCKKKNDRFLAIAVCSFIVGGFMIFNIIRSHPVFYLVIVCVSTGMLFGIIRYKKRKASDDENCSGL